MSSRRLARGAGKTATGAVPKEFKEYAKTDGFWDSRVRVEKWCEREGLDFPTDPYFAHPPGLRQWCIDAWATREGFVNKWGQVNRHKIEELGIWRGYGHSSVLASHSYLYRREDLDAWRPVSAPFDPNA